jgi:hypothetical protein
MADKIDGLDPLLINGDTDPGLIDDRMKALARQVIEYVRRNHYMSVDGEPNGGAGIGYNEEEAGDHLALIMHAQTSPLAVAAARAVLFVKTINDVAELAFTDENLKEIQITKYLADLTAPLQSLNLDTGVLTLGTALKGTSTAGLLLNDIIKVDRNDADDADVVFLPDAAQLESSADLPDVDAALAHKKYVDANWNPTLAVGMAGDSDSDGIATLGNGLKFAWGEGTVGGTAQATANILHGLTECFQVTANWTSGSDTSLDPIKIPTITNSTFTVKNTFAGGGNLNFRWIAIGR